MNFFKKKELKSSEKEKKTNEKVIIDKKINNSKVNKLVKFNGLKAIRGVFWTLIVILIIRGGVTLIKGDQAEAIAKQNELFLENLSKSTGLEAKLFSFAEEFTREFFTRYPSNTEDFKKRILKFTTEQLANDMNNSSYSEIINASAFSFEKYSDNQFDVSVCAKIKQYVLKPGQESVPQENKEYDTALVTEYIKVPIYISDNGEMIVEDIPGIIAAPEKAELKSTEYKGDEVTDLEEVKKINDMITEFFKAYYSGEQTQLDYFLENREDIKTETGRYTFEKVDSSSIYNLGNDEYLVTVSLRIKAFDNDLLQRFNLTLVKNGDKFLVKELNTRVKNLNIN